MTDSALDKATRLNHYRLLFGLSGDYSASELRSAYATLARLNHPDRNSGADSLAKMIIINEAYSFLKDYIPEKNGKPADKENADFEYSLYKEGFSIMKLAFDEYYGERRPKKNTGDRKILCSRLGEAKKIFSRLVNEFPGSGWTSDAIDKIFSINKWID